MSAFVFLSLFLMLFIGLPEKTQQNKRILVNDPQNILQQISQLQAELLDMKTKITSQEQKISAQEQKILAQGQNISAQEQKLVTQDITLQKMTNILSSIKQASGSVYTRWGNHHCPGNGAEEIYSGFAGGGWYDKPSTSPNYLCLPPDPQWNKYNDGTNGNNGQVYGVEYNDNFFYTDRNDRDVPCAVCRTNNSATTMIPARTDCYSGWKKEYSGYLGNNGENKHASSDYICVDSAAETLIHSQQNENGFLVSMVEGICGSLSCPPYVNGRELTCVVCSK